MSSYDIIKFDINHKGEKMFKKVVVLMVGLLVSLSIVGCGRAAPKPANNKVVYKSIDKVYLESNIPLNKYISGNIQDECALDTRLLDNLKEAAADNNIELIVGGKPGPKDAVLKLKIDNALSSGNAFIGHRKFVVVGGELYEGSKKITEFQVARRSGGGFFGGYKSSCAVLGGCTKTIAQDIVQWLKNPTENALLGNRELLRPRR